MADDSIDWVQDRLSEWADWCRGSYLNGWSSESAYCKERTSKPFFEMTENIGVTDRAVARVRIQSRRLWKAIRCKYLKNMGPKQLALEFGVDDAKAIVGNAEAAVGWEINTLETLQSSREYGTLAGGRVRITAPKKPERLA